MPMPTAQFISPELATSFLQRGLISFNADHQCALWFFEVLTFSDGQLCCFQHLWNNFFKGNLPMPQGRTLLAWRGDSSQASDLLKRHPAWKRIIVGDGKGHLWLHVPAEYLPNEVKGVGHACS